MLFDKYDTMYDKVYFVTGATTYKADPAHIPWPVALMLSTCHRKHRFQGKKLPQLKQYSESVNALVQKIKWAFWHKDSGENDNIRLGKRSSTPYCKHPGPLRLQSLCSAFRARLMKAGCVAVSSCRGLGALHSNVAGFHKYAMKWLKNSNYSVITTDKDGIFALVNRDELSQMILSKLEPSTYLRIRHNDVMPVAVYRDLFKHAKSIGELNGDVRITNEIKRVANMHGSDGIWSKLHFNIKTHKPAGKVGLRVLHNGGSNPMCGLMRLLRQKIKSTLSGADHICSSTQDFLEKLSRVHIFPGDFLVRIDMEDFYMAPSFQKLSEHSGLVDVDECYVQALNFVLENQFVSVVVDGFKHHFQLLKGSGMGTEISGDLCDSVLFWLSECKLLTPDSLSMYSIRSFLRFRDDVFIVAGDRSLFRDFFRAFRSSIDGVWKCKLEELSRKSVTMLDVTVYIDDNHKLGWLPYKKPTKHFIPLSVSSAHVPFVHSWPIAQVLRLYRNSSNMDHFKDACVTFVHDLIQSFHDGSVIAKVVERCMSINSNNCSLVSPSRCSSINNNDRRVLTLVLGYHPGFHNARLGRVVQSVLQDYEHEVASLFGAPLQIRIAWSNTQAPAHLKFRNL